MSDISIVIPTKNAGATFFDVLEAVYAQPGEYDVLVIDSGSTDETLDIVSDFPARLLTIPSAEFDHGGTRNLGITETSGQFIVFLTQDATPLDGWLTELIAPLREDSDIAGAYSRQLPRPTATPMKRHFLAEFYSDSSETRSIATNRSPTRTEVFFSNVSSVIRRSVWENHPFPTDCIMSEDQLWAWDVLQAGWKLRYQASSRVHHSHDEGIKQIFKRYFDSGASLSQREFATGDHDLSEMIRYQIQELQYLWENGYIHWLPYALLYSASKFSGLQLGKNHKWLPEWLVTRLSDTLSRKRWDS